MKYKEGIGWKAAYDEKTGKGGAEAVFRSPGTFSGYPRRFSDSFGKNAWE